MAQPMNNVLSARVSEAILKNIQEIAEERNRKTGDIVREAIELYLAEWADYKIAIERLKNHTDTILSEKDFLDELGWDI